MSEGETRTLFRKRVLEVVGIEEEAVWVIGREVPLPTTIRVEEELGQMEVMLPEPRDMCEEAPVSRNQSLVDCGCCRDSWFSVASNYGSSGEVAPAT
jgi:hypothetical protein